jgi:hypothetical protein
MRPARRIAKQAEERLDAPAVQLADERKELRFRASSTQRVDHEADAHWPRGRQTGGLSSSLGA